MQTSLAKLASVTIVAAMLCLTLGCGTHDTRTAGDLVMHFQEKGINGVYRPIFAQLIWCVGGRGLQNDDFSVEFYVFDDVSKAESLEKSGKFGRGMHVRNGSFILFILSPNKATDDLLEAFAEF